MKEGSFERDMSLYDIPGLRDIIRHWQAWLEAYGEKAEWKLYHRACEDLRNAREELTRRLNMAEHYNTWELGQWAHMEQGFYNDVFGNRTSKWGIFQYAFHFWKGDIDWDATLQTGKAEFVTHSICEFYF